MKTFAIATLGCKVNTFESESYIASLKQKGYQEVDFKEVADIYIINTCSVTNTAASKSRQKIHQAQRMNPDAMICVVGCYVQTDADSLESMPAIDVLIGAKNKSKLVDIIDSSNQFKEQIEESRDLDFEFLPLSSTDKTRAFLKIQDGCDQFCSYCIIPFARGNERSASLDSLVTMAQDLVASNHHEIVLSGIHIGRYGKGEGMDLVDLMKRLIEQVSGLKRLRLSSIEITEITDDLLDLMASSDIIARHLHIPIQSGCNTVLQRMNRPYTVEQYTQRVEEIRRRFPKISISTDVIVGFAGESDEEFEETVRTMRRLQFSFLHVFPYSLRKDTVAASMDHHVDPSIKKQRVAQLSELSKTLKSMYEMQFVNQEVWVLFDSYQSGKVTGFSSEYIAVSVLMDKRPLSQWYKVRITYRANHRCFGELVQEEEK